MENLHGNLEIFTKEIIIKMNAMGMEKCILQMELSIKGHGKEVYKQGDQL